MTEAMQKICKENGYLFAVEVPGRGICAVAQMLFTVGILYGIDENGMQGRWCYPSMADAVLNFTRWILEADGIGDPPGNWIKHKGRSGERSNPELKRVEL